MHSANLLHRDLKPSNLLLNSECHMKVADFGLARSLDTRDPDQQPLLTDYVATRWYRAPEILLGSNKYTKGVDMWSMGCILAELLLGKPVFPGTSTLNQLDRVMEVTGRPSQEDIDSINSPLAATMLESLPATKSKKLRDIFPTASDDALDLLRNLLQFNPTKRLTAEQALKHPYVAQFHNPEEEPICEKKIFIPIDDNQKFSIREYRNKLYSDIHKRKKEMRKRSSPNTKLTTTKWEDQAASPKHPRPNTEASLNHNTLSHSSSSTNNSNTTSSNNNSNIKLKSSSNTANHLTTSLKTDERVFS